MKQIFVLPKVSPVSLLCAEKGEVLPVELNLPFNIEEANKALENSSMCFLLAPGDKIQSVSMDQLMQTHYLYHETKIERDGNIQPEEKESGVNTGTDAGGN